MAGIWEPLSLVPPLVVGTALKAIEPSQESGVYLFLLMHSVISLFCNCSESSVSSQAQTLERCASRRSSSVVRHNDQFGNGDIGEFDFWLDLESAAVVEVTSEEEGVSVRRRGILRLRHN